MNASHDPELAAAWLVLGLQATTDKSSIQRAYAAQMVALRRARLDDDAHAVQRVRDACQRALDWAASAGPNADVAPLPAEAFGAWEDDDDPLPTPEPMPEPALDPRPEQTSEQTSEPAPESAQEAPYVQPPPADWQTLAEAAVQAVLASGWQPDTGVRLCHLCRQRRWQTPEAFAELKRALFTAVECAQPNAAMGASGAADTTAVWPCWISARLDLAFEFGGWLAPPAQADWQTMDDAAFDAFLADENAALAVAEEEEAAAGADGALKLRKSLVEDCARFLVQRCPSAAGRPTAALLAGWLAHPAFGEPENRLLLLQALAQQLQRAPFADPSLLGEAVAQLGLRRTPGQSASEPSADVLLDAWDALQAPTLLARIAAGELDHPQVHPHTAATLLAARVRWPDRCAAAVGFRSGDHMDVALMHRSVAWLQAHAPAALAACNPQVLAWWLAPKVQAKVLWFVPAAVGAALVGIAVAELWPERTRHKEWAAAMTLDASAVGAVAGWAFAAACAKGRIVWRARWQPAWHTWDSKHLHKLPWLGPWMAARGWWLSRDLVPLLLLLAHFGPASPDGYLLFGAWRLLLAWMASRV